MKQSELKNLILKTLENNVTSLDILKDNDNPQIIAIRNVYKGQCNALDAVLQAINNNPVYLRILSS